MSKDSFIRKYLKTVDNPSLPKFGVVEFTLSEGVGTDAGDKFIIDTKTSGPVTISCDGGTVEAHAGIANNTVAANSTGDGWFRRSAPMKVSLESLYNIRGVNMKYVTGIKNAISLGRFASKVNIVDSTVDFEELAEGLAYNENLLWLGFPVSESDKIFPLFPRWRNLVCYGISGVDSNTVYADCSLFTNTNIRQAAFSGDVALLPGTVDMISSNGTHPVYGELQTLVNKAKLIQGRPNSCIKINFWISSIDTLTWGGTSLNTYVADNFPSVNRGAAIYVVWNGDTVTFQNSQPAGYSNIYYESL